jgi:hypothetical protein
VGELGVLVAGDVVGVTSIAGESGAAKPPQADANSMIVIIDKKQKRTNLCQSLNNSLLRISKPPALWLG